METRWYGASRQFFRLGMSVSAYGSIRSLPDEASTKSGPACRFDQLSSARASVVHRRNEFCFLPAQAIIGKPLLRKAYTRDAYAPLLCRGVSWACAGALIRTLISKSHSKVLPRRFDSRPPVQLAIILDSSAPSAPPAKCQEF